MRIHLIRAKAPINGMFWPQQTKLAEVTAVALAGIFALNVDVCCSILLVLAANVSGAWFATRSVIYFWKSDIVIAAKGSRDLKRKAFFF